METRGIFIVICGIDGSGKSTQEDRLSHTLRLLGRKVYQTKNPSPWYREHSLVREFLDTGHSGVSFEAMALLAATDRLIQIETEIEPRLAAGVDVVCNRYLYSTYAYFEARGADMLFVEKINSKVPHPDKAILLTIDPFEAMRRIKGRVGHQTKFEERSAITLGHVQECIIKHWPRVFPMINGAQSIDTIAQSVAAYVVNADLS